MGVRYLFNSAGEYVGFLQNANLFAPDADWLGFVKDGNELYSPDGSFMGYILDDDRVARRRNEPRRPRVARPARPARPPRPPRPLRRLRMARLPNPWEDVFAEGIAGTTLGIANTIKSFENLDGSSLVAADGKLLGRVTRNPFDTESLTNQFGLGSPFRQESIFNEFGPYGSQFSQLSPFNQFSRTPPHFEKDGNLIAYLTANEFVTPRIEPRGFMAWLKRWAA